MWMNAISLTSNGTGSEEELDAVIRQLEKIRRESSGSLSQEAKLLKEEYARYQEGGPIYQLEQDLLQRAVEEDGGDSSKIYLQMAKLELSRDDEEKAREYMGQAFDTAGDSDDGDYGAPMLQMISLIGGKGGCGVSERYGFVCQERSGSSAGCEDSICRSRASGRISAVCNRSGGKRPGGGEYYGPGCLRF